MKQHLPVCKYLMTCIRKELVETVFAAQWVTRLGESLT